MFHSETKINELSSNVEMLNEEISRSDAEGTKFIEEGYKLRRKCEQMKLEIDEKSLRIQKHEQKIDVLKRCGSILQVS